ncbi:Hypothetical predicted protein [Pelobates cultripes]|uniref:Proline and serine rich 2 n=1 Tax=Pelobates cultripes TaxID=61616 RepID=A0AAD1RNQ6_PELCU|nr:Hypothetical predicted protein [Pelobates cultripes]
MPSNLIKQTSSEMEHGFARRRLSDFERSGSFDSQSSHSRSRSSNLDDENLKYLTNEEKNALLFFEETIDAFEDDIEELPFSENTSFGYSPRLTDDSHSESEDIIDLVQLDHSHVEKDILHDSGMDDRKHIYKDTQMSQSVMPVNSPMTVTAATVQTGTDGYSPDLPGEQRKFLGAVPTPVVIAQKISEKNADGGNLSPLSPRVSKPVEFKKNVGTSPISEEHFVFPSSASPKNGRFPTNIHIKPVGKQYNKTIAKAAVNVQERKAQVLANLNGPALFADEIDGKGHREQLSRSRGSSLRDAANEQTRYEALTKLGLVKEIPVQAEIPISPKSPISNGHHSPKLLLPELPRKHSGDQESINSVLMSDPSPFVPLGKSIIIKGDAMNKRHSTPQCLPEQKPPVPHQELRRTHSTPRPTGFRPQGITVQFSGRDASEESRKDALRKLGLIKDLSGH